MEDNFQDSKRVLVVDDNPNNRLVTSKLAQHLGYEVEAVSDGLAALEALKSEAFTIVLMDIRMAPIGGVETAQRIRNGEAGEGNKDIYIIALTAHSLPGDKKTCLAEGLNDYLTKPLSMGQLSESLKRAESVIFA